MATRTMAESAAAFFTTQLPAVITTSDTATKTTLGDQSVSWLSAVAVAVEKPEQQLWRVTRYYSHGDFEFIGQMTFEKMLETMKQDELRVAREAGMTGTDDEVIAKRLPVVEENNILRAISAGTFKPRTKLNKTNTFLASIASVFALSAAGYGLQALDEASRTTVNIRFRYDTPTPPPLPASVPAPAPVAEPEIDLRGTTRFEYSTNDGYVVVGGGEKTFGLRFTKAGDNSIHVYSDHPSVERIARAKGAKSGEALDFADYDSSSRVYTVAEGETFLVKNRNGHYMQARIHSITDDSRGDAMDQVMFDFQINPDKSAQFTGLSARPYAHQIVRRDAGAPKP